MWFHFKLWYHQHCSECLKCNFQSWIKCFFQRRCQKNENLAAILFVQIRVFWTWRCHGNLTFQHSLSMLNSIIPVFEPNSEFLFTIRLGNWDNRIQHAQTVFKIQVPRFYRKMPLEAYAYRRPFSDNASWLRRTDYADASSLVAHFEIEVCEVLISKQVTELRTCECYENWKILWHSIHTSTWLTSCDTKKSFIPRCLYKYMWWFFFKLVCYIGWFVLVPYRCFSVIVISETICISFDFFLLCFILH